MSKKIKLEIKEEQEALEEQIRNERIETSGVVTKPEVKNEQVVKIEIPEESSELGDSVLYCIGGKLSHSDRETGRWDHVPHPSISYLSHSLTTPHWTTIDWPHPRLFPGTVIHDHKLYIFGGNEAYSSFIDPTKVRDDPRYLDTIEVFDLRTKSWLPVRRLPFGMTRMTNICSLGDYIYILKAAYKKIDGINFLGFLRYCPTSNRFEEMQEPPGIRIGYSALLPLSGYLYALTGGNSHTGYLSMERYDLTTDWVVRTETERVYPLSATVHRGRIYAISPKYGLEVFCPETGSWTRLADTPDYDGETGKRVHGHLASINDYLLSVGNLRCLPHFKVFEFDLDAGVWIRKTDGNIPRNRFTVQVYNPSV